MKFYYIWAKFFSFEFKKKYKENTKIDTRNKKYEP